MFGKRLKAKREERGISQENLGKLLSVTQQTINNYENGKREPGQEMLIKISDLFAVSIHWLVKGTEFPIPDDPKYKGYSGTLEEEYAKKGLSPQTQRELLDAGIAAVEEYRKKYNLPRK